MKKHLFIVALLLISVLMTFTSCGGPTTEDPAEDPAPEMTFFLNEDNASYTLEGVSTQNISEVTIPSVYEGLPVTAIYFGAFQNCSKLTSIVIPDSVITIDEIAFTNCSGLTEVTLGKNVTTIGASAFEGCTSLTKINLPEGLTTIRENAFRNCTSLTEIHIPSSVTRIDSGAFGGCDDLFETENGVTYLDTWAIGFENEDELPADLTFRDGTLCIDGYAFSGCENLKSITIPDSVIYIGSFAFSRCGDGNGSLRITIGKGVKLLGGCIFDYCNISSLTYNGTVDEWNLIEKSNGVYGSYSDWCSESGHAVTVNCTDGSVDG